MLEIEKIIKHIKEGNRIDLTAATKFQSWLQGHFNIDESGQSYVKKNALKLAKSILPDDKVKILECLLISPLPSVDILGEAYEKLQAVLSGRNASVNFSGSAGNENGIKDWLSENKTESQFKNRAWELFKVAPNSLVVIDSPNVDSENKEPYITFCDISKLFACEKVKGKNLLKWAVIEESSDLYLIYTDTVFARFEKVKTNEDSEGSFFYSEIPHNIGLCPVNFMWQSAGNATISSIKQTPVLPQLAELDKYVFAKTAYFNQINTSIFPILTVLEQACSYNETIEIPEADRIGGISYRVINCEGGKVDGKECPSCGGKSLAGAGVVIGKPAPMGDQKEITKAAEYVAPPIADVEFTKRELYDLKNEIITSITGKASTLEGKVAINKDQVFANKQDRETILKNLSLNFSYIQTWAINTLIRLKFQSDKIKYSCNYGTEFFTRTELELIQLIGESKSVGMPLWYIKSLEQELAELKNVGNKEREARQRVMDAIEPTPSLSLQEAREISEIHFLSKALFPEFVREYELVNGSIGNYEGDFRLHITDLNNKLTKFIKNVNTGREENATKTDQNESATNPRG